MSSNQSQTKWLLAALTAHAGWGAYVVIGRYLQTVANLPTLSILVVGTTPMWVALFFYTLPRIGWQVFADRTVQIMAIFALARAATNLLAARYTLAIYIQLIYLLTPFIVVLLNRLFLRDRVPKGTLIAVTLSIIGATFVLSERLSSTGLTFDLTARDWLGMGIALLSCVTLASYMMAVRNTANSPVSGFDALVVQSVFMWILSLGISLATGEEWGQWLTINRTTFFVELSHIVFIIFGANMLQIAAIRHIGAPTVSTIMPFRLISTLLFSWLLLGERLQSWWQALGAAVVLVTVSVYLWRQRPNS